MTEGSDSAKRSPLKSRPLRNPGQSLDEAFERVIGDQRGSLRPALVCVPVVRTS